MKRILFLLFTILIFAKLDAQNLIVTGTITDECGEPIAGALILIKNTMIATITDFNGKYVLKNIPENSKILQYSYTGRETKELRLNNYTVFEDTLILDVILYEDTNKIDEVKVTAKKPIIYLYPEKEISVDVKFNFFGNVQNTYPEYYDGWHVVAKPNGEIVNKKDNTVHRYLFWDGTLAKNPEISEFNTGFIVKGTETVYFLDSILTLVGFNQFEKNDFITYWIPVLKKNEYNFVHFLVNENCNNIATMNITPKPDSEIRVYMLFSAIDEPFEIKPQNLKTFDRKGYTVIEWGGMDLNKLKVE